METASSGPRHKYLRRVAKHVCTVRYALFHLLPLLGALAISFEVWYLSDKREAKEAEQAFQHLTSNIVLSVQLAATITIMQPNFLVSLYFATQVPSSLEFSRFTLLNPYWNIAGTIKEVEWVPAVLDRDRAAFEAMHPLIMIWQFGPEGKIEQPRGSHDIYCPILYDPGNDFILGLDLCNDPVEGPLIRGVAQNASTVSASPFQLRGLPPREAEYPMGTTVYMPLFRNDSVGKLTVEKSNVFVGCVVTVIHFQTLLTNVLKAMDPQNVDVFLFSSGGTYLAHYEGGPDSSSPNLAFAAAMGLHMSDIAGDFVSPPFAVSMVDATYMVVVRARQGHYTQGYRTALPIILLCISLFVKFADKVMLYIEKRVYKKQPHYDFRRDSLPPQPLSPPPPPPPQPQPPPRLKPTPQPSQELKSSPCPELHSAIVYRHCDELPSPFKPAKAGLHTPREMRESGFHMLRSPFAQESEPALAP